jgi:hypothetical protein
MGNHSETTQRHNREYKNLYRSGNLKSWVRMSTPHVLRDLPFLHHLHTCHPYHPPASRGTEPNHKTEEVGLEQPPEQMVREKISSSLPASSRSRPYIYAQINMWCIYLYYCEVFRVCIPFRHVFLTPTCHVSGFPWLVINVDAWIWWSGLFYNSCNLVPTLHESHKITFSVCLLCSQLPRWLNLTWVSCADCSRWMLTAHWSPPWFELISWLLIPYCSDLSMSLIWLLGSHTDCFLLSKSTLLSRSFGLVREHLVQRFSLSSTQRWLAYSVAMGNQQFDLCCVGSFLGSVCLCVRSHWNARSYCGRCVAMDVI